MTIDPPRDVVVVGAGAAGLVAAAEAAALGKRTLLLERNRRPGVKILMSGGTRCNLTHATDKWGVIQAYGDQGNFLHSALAVLSPADLVQLIEEEGVATKVEETGKVFPVSNRASDVLDALLQRLKRSRAELALEEAVVELHRRPDSGFRLRTTKRSIETDVVIITVGGQSYPGSGTRGDGYAWARSLGHTIVPPRPALVPLTTDASWVRDLSGITLPDVAVELLPAAAAAGKPLDRRRGSLLFTHFGLSGPVVLDISRSYTALSVSEAAGAVIACDFLPDLATAHLDEALRRAASDDGRRQMVAVLANHIPRRLAEALLGVAGIRAELRGAELSRIARESLVHVIKRARVPITGTRGFAKAEVTAGGIDLDEIDSRTMQSKLIAGLYFAGEILDLDGPIGGYNFQAAFSTGVLAGRSVGRS